MKNVMWKFCKRGGWKVEGGGRRKRRKRKRKRKIIF
jgi:hypothetical protein